MDVLFLVGVIFLSVYTRFWAGALIALATIAYAGGMVTLHVTESSIIQDVPRVVLALSALALPGLGFLLARSQTAKASSDRKPKLQELTGMFFIVFLFYAGVIALVGLWKLLGTRNFAVLLGAAMVLVFVYAAVESRRPAR